MDRKDDQKESAAGVTRVVYPPRFGAKVVMVEQTYRDFGLTAAEFQAISIRPTAEKP